MRCCGLCSRCSYAAFVGRSQNGARHGFPRVLVDRHFWDFGCRVPSFPTCSSKWLRERIGCGGGCARRFPLTPRVPAAAPASAGEAAHGERIDHSRRHFFHAAGFVAGAVPFVSAAYGFVAERFRYQIREVEIPIANLPRALDGLRITQISDIHAGSYMPMSQVRRAVGMANELGGDLIVVTGDFMTTRGDPLEDCIAELSRLRAPLGVWGCNGNHEIYAGVRSESRGLFGSDGMRLLRQENAEMRWKGSAIQSDRRGLPAAARRRAESRAHAGRRRTAGPPRHSEYSAFAQSEFFSARGGDGHRAVPRGPHARRPGARRNSRSPLEPRAVSHAVRRRGFIAARCHSSSQLSDEDVFSRPGIQQVASGTIYVNRGLGTIGAPVRLGVPPEITLITLRCA